MVRTLAGAMTMPFKLMSRCWGRSVCSRPREWSIGANDLLKREDRTVANPLPRRPRLPSGRRPDPPTHLPTSLTINPAEAPQGRQSDLQTSSTGC